MFFFLKFNFLPLLLLFLPLLINCDLELINDDELVNLIRSENYVVALFTKKYCEECEKYENELTSLREDLVENLNAWVVKLDDSSMSRLYSTEKEPSIVFFRHGIPLLYYGPLNDELILHTFTANKEPAVKELNDETFEHLTQASSGATTGDWFVMFYTTECIDCQRLQAKWEAVAANLKSRLNVARVNRATSGAQTARRFNIFDVPTFILFRQGRMYKYHNQDYAIESFIAFAKDWYKNVKFESVPVPKSPFDDLLTATVHFMKENPYLWQLGFSALLFGVILHTVFKFCSRKVDDEEPKKSTKRSSTVKRD